MKRKLLKPFLGGKPMPARDDFFPLLCFLFFVKVKKKVEAVESQI